MQTSLPDLPFTNYGNAELDDFRSHSVAKSTPRTDLQTLTPWTSFPDEIHQAIQSATARANLRPAPFPITASQNTRVVETEEAIRAHATFTLHEPVEEVLKMLGVKGRFALVADGGNPAIVGDPDFAWVVGCAEPHPKIIVEYKTWWETDLVDLPAAFEHEGTRHDVLSQQSLHALEQIYGYMTFNNNKFGILTNWQRTWFLRRTGTLGRRTLEYYLVELDGQSPSISMLKAWVGMVLLAEDDWFYESPTLSSALVFTVDGEHMIPNSIVNGSLPSLPGSHQGSEVSSTRGLALDFHLCRFDLSSARRGAMSYVVNARFQQPSVGKSDLHVICKVVDVLRNPDATDWLEEEVRAYAALQNLQGQVIPKLYGFYKIWGILWLLALEPVGNAIPEDEHIDQTLRMKMKAALQCIHDAGFIHGDIARHNFCRTERGDVFLVDLERCQLAENPSELGNEMKKVDWL